MALLLITGAAGYIGRALAASALDAGWSVRGLVRRPEQVRQLLPSEVELVAGDIRDASSLRNAVRDVDAVVHLVAISYERAHETFDAIHVGGTRTLLEAMAGAGVGRIVYMSALGTRPNAPSRFHQSRWAAEQAVRDSGLNWTILRPSLVLGPGDYFVSLHLRLLRSLPVLPVIGSGQQLLQPIALHDLAYAAVRVLAQTTNETYDAVGPLRLSLHDLQSLIMKLVGRHRPRLHMPLFLAALGAPLLEYGSSPPLLTRDQLVLLREDNIGAAGPLQHATQRVFVSPREALGYLRTIDLQTAHGVRIGS